MRIAIVGTGGVGGYFGAKLARGGEDVWFLARGTHLETMRRHGLRIHTPNETFTVPAGTMTSDPAEIGPVDAVLFCVKSYDTETAARQLAPMLTERTVVISLQNGVENEEVMQKLIPRGTVYGGVAYIYATITAPGEITESGGPRKIVFGPLRQESDAIAAQARGVLAACTRSGIDAELSSDITTVLWKKMIFICAVGGVTALTRLTLGELLAVPESRTLLNVAMEEAAAVARTEGAQIEEDYVSGTFERLKSFDNNTRSSLYHDLTRQKPLEIDALSGTIVRLGLKHGVPTPVHATIYAALLPYHVKAGGAVHPR